MSTTLQKLQAHVKSGEPIGVAHPHLSRMPATHVVCQDGFTLSVQASRHTYCTPQNDDGPYSKVEVWMCGNVPEFSEAVGGDSEYPYGYVPIEIVAQVIDQHGGFKG